MVTITTTVSARDISVQMTDEADVAAEMLVSFASEGWSCSDEHFVGYLKAELRASGPFGNEALSRLGELLIEAAK